MAVKESLLTSRWSPVPPPAAPWNRIPPAPTLRAGLPACEKMKYESKPLPRLTVIPDTLESAKVWEAAPLIVVPIPSISTVLASSRKTLTVLSPRSLVSVSAVPFTAAATFPERSERTSRTSAAGKTGVKRRQTRRGRRRERRREESHDNDTSGLESFMVCTLGEGQRYEEKTNGPTAATASCGSSRLHFLSRKVRLHGRIASPVTHRILGVSGNIKQVSSSS